MSRRDDDRRLTDVEAAITAIDRHLKRALLRQHGLRAMDAWHLAAAVTLTAELTDPREAVAFASRGAEQADVASSLGFAAA